MDSALHVPARIVPGKLMGGSSCAGATLERPLERLSAGLGNQLIGTAIGLEPMTADGEVFILRIGVERQPEPETVREGYFLV